MASSEMALALLLLLLSVDASAAWSWEPIANCDLDPGLPCMDDCMKRGHWSWTCDNACYYCGGGTYIGGGFMQISSISPDDDNNAKTIQNSLAPAATPPLARKLRL